jgi:hypothetical protein
VWQWNAYQKKYKITGKEQESKYLKPTVPMHNWLQEQKW